MSFGKKVEVAVRALQRENKLPPGLRTNELEQLIADKLAELYGRGRAPSPRTFFRHLDRVRALTDGSDCHFRDGTVIGISDAAEQPTTKGQDDMRLSDHRTLENITGAVQTWVQVVPWDHGLDEVLDPAYFHPGHQRLREGDRIELQAADFSWMAGFLVVSVNRSARTVSTLLTQPPTFLMRAADRTELYLIDAFQKVETAFQKMEMRRDEYEQRMQVLQSLRDQGRYPSPWLADKLMQVHRAEKAGRLTRAQHAAAVQGLLDVMPAGQADEVNKLICGVKAEPSSAPIEAPAAEASPEKPAKKKPTLVTPPAAPTEFGQLKCTSTPPETRASTPRVTGEPLMKRPPF